MKTLAQSIPAAGVLTDVYVPNTAGNVLSILICNQQNKPATYRISVAVAGAADALKQYHFYDVAIDQNATIEFSPRFGVPLAATDVLRCMSSNGQISFNLLGEGP